VSTSALAPGAAERPDRLLHVALWFAQLMLALLFGSVGWTKATLPLAEVAAELPRMADVPGWLVRVIGVSELAGALGMVLPALTRIQPALTPLAGIGLGAVMALAIVFHLIRGETPATGLPATLGALSAFVAWGRLERARIEPRA
jgi:uncharacterized membrane protein YphA (DoxX/SURF4 family)